jgi:hypothetical protein
MLCPALSEDRAASSRFWNGNRRGVLFGLAVTAGVSELVGHLGDGRRRAWSFRLEPMAVLVQV